MALKIRPWALVAAGALAVGSLAALAPAHAADSTVVTVRPTDLLPGLSDTRDAGHVAFLADGLRVWTDDGSGDAKAAEYFAVDRGIPSSSTIDWAGTQPQASVQIVFDVDATTGNDNDWNVLVGEPVYGVDGDGNITDWWMTGGTARAALRGITCPSTTGGSSSDCHGTLAQWRDALTDGRMYAGGFSLGSGVHGNGAIFSIGYDNTEYRFSNTAAAAATVRVDVTGKATFKKAVKRKKVVAKLTLSSVNQPADTEVGKRLGWTVKVDGKTVFSTQQQFGDSARWRHVFKKRTGKHAVTVIQNGKQLRTYKVRTGRR